MSAVIELRGASVSYGAATALRDIDLDIEAGTVTALIGPNGSGKSTLLSLIAGLLEPTRGTMRLHLTNTEHGRIPIAYVLQRTESNRLLPVTVREVVTMARYGERGLLARLRREDRAAVQVAMERMDVAELADRHLSELSGGQRQRALVAQGLAQEAEVLLLDEPVIGLDLLSQRLILDVIAEERQRGRTVLLSTHDLADAKRADHVVLLKGRVVACGTPDAVLATDILREAYGRRLVPLDGETMLEDIHSHGHSHPHRP